MTDDREQERKARTHRRATSKKLRNGIEKFHPVTLAGDFPSGGVVPFSRESCLSESYYTQ